MKNTCILFVAQRRNSGRGRHILEVSRSHTIRHTHIHPVGLLWTSDKLVAEAAAYASHNKYQRRTSMPSAGFESAIPAIKRLLTYALDSTATAIGNCSLESDYKDFLSGVKNYNGSNVSNVLIGFIGKFYVPHAGSIVYLRQNFLYSRDAVVGP